MTVLEIVLLAAAGLGAAWGSVLVHESGHYLLGRWLGVPSDSMRIRLQRPPHVALRHGDTWLSPDDQEYASTFAQHNSSRVAAWFFIAGGFLVETVVALALAAVLVTVGTVSLVIVGASTAVLLLYAIADGALSARRGQPYGDFTAMWRLSRGATATALMIVLLLRVSAVLLLV